MALLETHLPNILYRGKVRDTYDLGNNLLLMVATDRISAFDVVLPSGIPEKGRILTRISKFWFDLTENVVPNHLVSLADDRDTLGDLNEHPILKDLPPEIAAQSMVVHKANRIDVECVVRAYLTGSALAEYKNSGTVFGLPVPSGLEDGDRLPELMFTPTTKAETGHDEPMTESEVAEMVGGELAGRLKQTSFDVFSLAHDHAISKGIIIADTKFEFGIVDEKLTLIDEVLTPDSSRFWDAEGYSPGKSQPNFDKQYVRDYLVSAGWDREPPAPELPEEVIIKTKERYEDAFFRITGKKVY